MKEDAEHMRPSCKIQGLHTLIYRGSLILVPARIKYLVFSDVKFTTQGGPEQI